MLRRFECLPKAGIVRAESFYMFELMTVVILAHVAVALFVIRLTFGRQPKAVLHKLGEDSKQTQQENPFAEAA